MKASCNTGCGCFCSPKRCMCMLVIGKSVSCGKAPGTPNWSIGAEEDLRSLRDPERGGSSMGEVPLLGERVDAEELSETREGAPSADICEKAEGDGRGVSTRRC